jgi:hypothetical protein
MSYWRQYDINEESLIKYLNYISDILKLGERILDYSEKHHIIPKSVDPAFSKDRDNLIKLSGREHFEAHKLLLDCFNDENKAFIYYSFNLMCNSLHNNNYNITPEDYEAFRKEFRSICVENNTGSKNPNYGKKHPGINAGKNNPNYGNTYSEEFKAYLSELKKGSKNPRFNTKHTDTTKALIGTNSKGRVWVNNGIKNKFIKPEELECYVDLGFIYKGCLITGKNKLIK